MKNGKNPTVAQKKIIASYKHKSTYLNPANWLIVKNLPDVLVIKHRDTPTVIHIPKGGESDD